MIPSKQYGLEDALLEAQSFIDDLPLRIAKLPKPAGRGERKTNLNQLNEIGANLARLIDKYKNLKGKGVEDFITAIRLKMNRADALEGLALMDSEEAKLNKRLGGFTRQREYLPDKQFVADFIKFEKPAGGWPSMDAAAGAASDKLNKAREAAPDKFHLTAQDTFIIIRGWMADEPIVRAAYMEDKAETITSTASSALWADSEFGQLESTEGVGAIDTRGENLPLTAAWSETFAREAKSAFNSPENLQKRRERAQTEGRRLRELIAARHTA